MCSNSDSSAAAAPSATPGEDTDVTLTCPNCLGPVAQSGHGCVLHALFALLADRDEATRDELQRLHANTDVDAFWEDVGPVIDDLGRGRYRLLEDC